MWARTQRLSSSLWRRRSPEEFGEIIIRESTGGAVVRVKDVARVELGAQAYNMVSRLDGKEAAIIAAYQLPGSNAVQAANEIRKLMAELKGRLPEDVDYVISLDTTEAAPSRLWMFHAGRASERPGLRDRWPTRLLAKRFFDDKSPGRGK
jgi:multidrug efflux pump subunit AcrB